jgi:hypothetical protein|tara:strand:+ start:9617 stop:9826 length:210 start_codon:yes stop_codon:yes gene_type:complete
MKRLLVKENKKLERDTQTKAILSNDIDGYKAAIARRSLRKSKEKEFNELKNKVDNLTTLVEKLVEKLDK